MLVAGIASSHAPTMFVTVPDWKGIYDALIADVPQPSSAEAETDEVNEELRARILSAFAALKGVLEEARPDVVIVVGDDQNEVFGPAFNPTLAVFCGDKAGGTINVGLAGQNEAENHVYFNTDPEFAKFLAKGLTERHFDPATMTEIVPLSRPEAGLGHAFTRPVVSVGIGENGPAVVPLFLNAYHEPLPSAQRCYDLGKAIREIANDWPGRVAIFGSGGLSHDPLGPRAGWIDQKLDRWVLDRIQKGKTRELNGLFTFESDALRGGTGEIRSWITVAGAYEDQPGVVVDYVPVHHAVTGLGFAYWTS